MPVRYLLLERAARYSLRKEEHVKIGELTVLRENIDQDTRKRIQWEVVRLWQSAWESSKKGRITFCYFPTIVGTLTSGWISLNHYLTQFLTGHGNFISKLADPRCIEDGSCSFASKALSLKEADIANN